MRPKLALLNYCESRYIFSTATCTTVIRSIFTLPQPHRTQFEWNMSCGLWNIIFRKILQNSWFLRSLKFIVLSNNIETQHSYNSTHSFLFLFHSFKWSGQCFIVLSSCIANIFLSSYPMLFWIKVSWPRRIIFLLYCKFTWCEGSKRQECM